MKQQGEIFYGWINVEGFKFSVGFGTGLGREEGDTRINYPVELSTKSIGRIKYEIIHWSSLNYSFKTLLRI